jgi:hypothetical protein
MCARLPPCSGEFLVVVMVDLSMPSAQAFEQSFDAAPDSASE